MQVYTRYTQFLLNAVQAYSTEQRIFIFLRSIMNYIYVVDKKGKPLMPTTRQSHVRRLIKNIILNTIINILVFFER